MDDLRASLGGSAINRLALGCVQHLVMMNLLRGDINNCGLHLSELLRFHKLGGVGAFKAKQIHSRAVKYMFNGSIQGQQAVT